MISFEPSLRQNSLCIVVFPRDNYSDIQRYLLEICPEKCTFRQSGEPRESEIRSTPPVMVVLIGDTIPTQSHGHKDYKLKRSTEA